jgi:ribonuclease P protein component
MIPSKRKVTTGLFKFVIEKGRSYHTEYFSLRVFSNNSNSLDLARFSVAVSKKVDKKAVGRNILKRRLYKIVEPLLFSAKSGSLCVFFVKKKFNTKETPLVSEEVAATLKKAGVVS